MTFEDDFIRIVDGLPYVPLAAVGLTWPPPEVIELGGIMYERLQFSDITDEQRADMTHVCRGALYTLLLVQGNA